MKQFELSHEIIKKQSERWKTTKDFSVKVYIDGQIIEYENCDREFVADLLMCPCCTGKEYSITAWNNAFAEKSHNTK